MSELEIKRSEALTAISVTLANTEKNPVISVHELSVLALGIADELVELGATIGEHVLSQGRGKPQLRQRFYEAKVEVFRDILGDRLLDVTRPEDKIVDEVLPSYITDVDETDAYPTDEEDKA